MGTAGITHEGIGLFHERVFLFNELQMADGQASRRGGGTSFLI
jgi:hypothetical protein